MIIWIPFIYFICLLSCLPFLFFFFFNDTATTEIYTLSLHDALPIWSARRSLLGCWSVPVCHRLWHHGAGRGGTLPRRGRGGGSGAGGAVTRYLPEGRRDNGALAGGGPGARG